LYEDGQVIAVIQEERLRRVKNWAGMPTEAIAAVLKMRGISADQVDVVAMNGHHVAFPMTRDELAGEYRTINDFGITLRRSIQRAIRGVHEQGHRARTMKHVSRIQIILEEVRERRVPYSFYPLSLTMWLMKTG
jgi:predicted NodU family carbamoyl transferase